jgi:hypothetical protein
MYDRWRRAGEIFRRNEGYEEVSKRLGELSNSELFLRG